MMKVEILIDGTIRESLTRAQADLAAKFMRGVREGMSDALAADIRKHAACACIAYHATDWMDTRPVLTGSRP
jgi:hypothetical protein